MMASLCLALALVSDPLAGRLCGKGPTPPDGYSPPLISNGDLNMLVEWTGGQSGRAYNQMRTTVYWQGRRGPARDAELFAFGRFNPTMVVEGKAVGLPTAWSQTLDVRQALVTCVGAFVEGLEATTEVFCALDRNVVAIRRTVANTSGKPLNLTLDLAYTIEPHSRLVGAWTKQDRYFETSPYVRMRGIWEEPNTDVRRVFHGLTYGQNVIGFDIAVTACDGGFLRRDVTLAPGAKTSHAWFVTYSDTYEKTPTAIPQTDWDGLFATHAKLWADYWAESFVRLPDAKLQRMYDVQQYHLRCNVTRWGFPVGIFPFHWQGKYFGFDEMYIHDGLVSSGHFSVARRCPDWRYAVMHRALTRQSHYTKRGKYGARWLWMSLEEGDVETAGIGFWMDHIFAMGSIARSAWTQYAYSGDRDYLEKVGYPIVLECARFYRNNWILEGPDGVAWIGRCTDLERLGPSKDKAFLSTCSAIYALRVAADAADVLGVDRDEAADFRTAADRLVKGLPTDPTGTRYVAYENCTEESVGTLGGLYPFPIFPNGETRQTNAAWHFINAGKAAGNMYPMGKSVCPWYAAKMSASMTELGDRTEPARWLLEAAGAMGPFGETWEINEPGLRIHPWFTTASGNCVFAVNEMLVRGTVPETWKGYAFRLPDGKGRWIDCEVKDGRRVRFHRTGISRVGSVAKERGF